MRARARWGITPLLAAPAGSWALGLGDIELQSALNQPFRAEIALQATADEMQGLRITLASPDTFERYGLERPDFLTELEFQVVAAGDGRNVVQVTSRESIAEPFVTLLLEATWPRGRTLKEYTVLLDPPVLLPAPAVPPAVRPAETRPSAGSAPGGEISRAPAPAPAVPEAAPSVSTTVPPPAQAAGGAYGPVQRAETLWAISDRLRPAGVTINQMMIAIYRANPEAFGGNINVLRAGTTLRLPQSADFESLVVTEANAEVRRHIDEWRNRAPQGGQLRLLPPADADVASTPPPSQPTAAPAAPPAPPAPAARAAEPPPAAAPAPVGEAAPAVDESRRLLEIRNAELQNLQQAAAAADPAAAAPAADVEAAAPGVELEREQLFTDEDEPAAEAPARDAVPAPAAPAPVAAEPSRVSQAVGWLLSPLLWIGLGVAALLLTALWFVRRRRQEAQDATGRWEALEAEEGRDATESARRPLPEPTIVVEEQRAGGLRPVPEADAASERDAQRAQRPNAPADDTLSSQTVINLDQSDTIAEADFHSAYGLYDQAAELVQKALAAAPDRRDLKLKLLEVFFMWGNKDAFLKAARALRADIGRADDPDWNKVVIMGRQICPDEALFAEATPGGGDVDVDLEAGDSPLDLAFDDAAADDVAVAASSDLDFNFDDDDAPPTAKASPKTPARDFGGDALEIGARTAAGLEAALFEDLEDDDKNEPDAQRAKDDSGGAPADLAADSLAVTQESPTVERLSDWGTVESSADAPTVETPTIESLAAHATAKLGTKTVAIPRRSDPPTVEQPSLTGGQSDYTAEIDLDDLGLDVNDLQGLPSDLGDLPTPPPGESDTREQPALRGDDSLLSATGVTKVLHGDDDELEESSASVVADEEATQLAPRFAEATTTLTGTQVLEGRLELDDESGSTSLVKALRGEAKGEGDLDLEDFTAALHGGDTVEQPRAASFSRDVFGGGDTPLDLDIGTDVAVGDDAARGEDFALDSQTMTEVGTKLDLARAYIDMGDPEGARSILEEVLGEGDSNQRREAQGLIDALSD